MGIYRINGYRSSTEKVWNNRKCHYPAGGYTLKISRVAFSCPALELLIHLQSTLFGPFK
jgi:hypothetical protein